MLVDFNICRHEIVKYLKYKGSSKKFLVFKMLNTLVAEFKINLIPSDTDSEWFHSTN
jgi:hypothetical protein